MRTDWLVSKDRKVDGQNVLYHYIQKSILGEKDTFSKDLLQRLLTDLSIWIPINFYRRLPIILPYVVRDPSCRRKNETGEDEWGSANSNGFLRDDNSLIKGIVRSFSIRSPTISVYNGLKLGKGFVASHIWRNVIVQDKQMIASRHHMLNSFVPNLVWLPVQISKLTDREGSLAQKLLQVISHMIYKQISLPREVVNVWEALKYPRDMPEISIDVTKLNFFAVPNEWLLKRTCSLISEIDYLLSESYISEAKVRKIKSSRYVPTLKQIPRSRRSELSDWLTEYRVFLHSSSS
jgi:hypothetical protein